MQAVARTASGTPYQNTEIQVRFSIIDSDPENGASYVEIHNQRPLVVDYLILLSFASAIFLTKTNIFISNFNIQI